MLLALQHKKFTFWVVSKKNKFEKNPREREKSEKRFHYHLVGDHFKKHWSSWARVDVRRENRSLEPVDKEKSEEVKRSQRRSRSTPLSRYSNYTMQWLAPSQTWINALAPFFALHQTSRICIVPLLTRPITYPLRTTTERTGHSLSELRVWRKSKGVALGNGHAPKRK